MAHYIDGFVIPVPKKKINAYRHMAGKAGKVWRDHGALEFRECVGDDLNVKMCLSFPRGIRTKPGETVLFSYTCLSRAAIVILGTERDKRGDTKEICNGKGNP
jgi:uncharacterized protein YbaA (DUF1428 family)